MTIHKPGFKYISSLYLKIPHYRGRIISNIYFQFSLGSHFGAIRWCNGNIYRTPKYS
ncbi:uncharacterized protein DS421_8g228100 [Arachis hypogaea]|nr:uncharacterized protein DS421_8g228100 [Arachis hypogaea]